MLCRISLLSVFLPLSACGYWNPVTLKGIYEHAILFYNKLENNTSELLKKIKIVDADINVEYTSNCQGVLSHNSDSSKEFLKKINLENANDTTTGFLLCFSDYSISCVIQQNLSLVVPTMISSNFIKVHYYCSIMTFL